MQADVTLHASRGFCQTGVLTPERVQAVLAYQAKTRGENRVGVYLALVEFLFFMCCKTQMTESTGEDGRKVLRVLLLLWWAGRGLVAVVEGESL